MTHEFCVASQKTQASSLRKTLEVYSGAQILCSETSVLEFFYLKHTWENERAPFIWEPWNYTQIQDEATAVDVATVALISSALVTLCSQLSFIVFFFFRTQSLLFKPLLLMVRPPTTLLHKTESRSLPKSLLRRCLLSIMRTGSCCNRLPFQRSLGNTAWQWMAADAYLCK